MKLVSEYKKYIMAFENSKDTEVAHELALAENFDFMYCAIPFAFIEGCGWGLGFQKKDECDKFFSMIKTRLNIYGIFQQRSETKWVKM